MTFAFGRSVVMATGLVVLLVAGSACTQGGNLRGPGEPTGGSKAPETSKDKAQNRGPGTEGTGVLITGRVTADGRPVTDGFVVLVPYGKAVIDRQGYYAIRSSYAPVGCVLATLTVEGSRFGQMVVKDRPIRRGQHVVWNIRLKKVPTTVSFKGSTSKAASGCVLPSELRPPEPEWPVIDQGSFALPGQTWFLDADRGYGLEYGCNDWQEKPEIRCSIQVTTTTDSGRTWVPTSEAFRISYPRLRQHDYFDAHIRFADINNGWLFGRKLMSTHDAGKTWTEEGVPTPVSFLTSAGDVAWAIAGACEEPDCKPALYTARVSEGGWAPLKAQPVGLLKDGQVFALGRTTLFATTTVGPSHDEQAALNLTRDSGASWSQEFLPCMSHRSKGALAVLKVNRIWLACGGGPSTSDQPTQLYKSLDAGRRWRLVAQTALYGSREAIGNIPEGGFLGTLVITSNGSLFMSRKKFGTVARSTDGGRTWQTQLNDDGGGGYELSFVDNHHGWARTTGALYGTSDAGQHWDLRARRPGY